MALKKTKFILPEKEKTFKVNNKLDLKDCNLAGGIAFITKFTRIFHKIKSIDFGKENLNKNEMAEFGEQLKVNKYI